MDRRDFLKTSGMAAASFAFAGCISKHEDASEKSIFIKEQPKLRENIARAVDVLEPLHIKEITVAAGPTKPFSVMHVSDTHITRVDNRNDERKIALAADRSRWMNRGEHYLDETIRYANEHGMYMMHTGDLYDFVSEANLDCAAEHMLSADWFVCAGNHEYSKYVGEAKEDEAYKNDSREAVQAAFPNNLTFASRIINGINFVALDDVYYNFTAYQHARMEEEMKKGLPVVMLCHVPLYTPGFLASELENSNGNCGYLTGVPVEFTSKYDPDVTYPVGEEWRYRKVQQHADKATLDFVAWLKEQTLLKAILCGHLHRYFEERFSPSAIQYAVDATYLGGVQVVHFK
ncbi:MAG: metallophosphoesterase [Prevotella sp.]|nr:metallophosphoesterase [Prevotella sp.]